MCGSGVRLSDAHWGTALFPRVGGVQRDQSGVESVSCSVGTDVASSLRAASAATVRFVAEFF